MTTGDANYHTITTMSDPKTYWIRFSFYIL
jgi:hypothetical protein